MTAKDVTEKPSAPAASTPASGSVRTFQCKIVAGLIAATYWLWALYRAGWGENCDHQMTMSLIGIVWWRIESKQAPNDGR